MSDPKKDTRGESNHSMKRKYKNSGQQELKIKPEINKQTNNTCPECDLVLGPRKLAAHIKNIHSNEATRYK